MSASRQTSNFNPREPWSYPRRVLLAVTGLSPQVVTETLYALAVKPPVEGSPFVPTEVHLITTAQGADHARLNLLSERPGWFHRLRDDYGLPVMRFENATIHVVADASGQPLNDIRTPSDNECVADRIAAIVCDLTLNADTAVHVSLAGGRKTMGYYLGYALSLYGRAQDRLSHVLVSAPFESHPEFYYPTREQRVIQTREQRPRPLDCRDAEVSLAEIPFVSLRHGLPIDLLSGRAGFNDTVAAARRALGPAELVVDHRGHRIRASGITIEMPPTELALLAVFARRAQRSDEPIQAPPKAAADAWSKRYLAEFAQTEEDFDPMTSRVARTLSKGMGDDFFSQKLSKLRTRLKNALGPAARQYLIDDGGGRVHRYRLDLSPEAIRFAATARRIGRAAPARKVAAEDNSAKRNPL